jgi:uncharacterized protein YbaA (DUF1428 family)
MPAIFSASLKVWRKPDCRRYAGQRERKDDETVVFSWIIWPSREMRDQGMKKVMADPRLQPDADALRRKTPDLRRL